MKKMLLLFFALLSLGLGHGTAVGMQPAQLSQRRDEWQSFIDKNTTDQLQSKIQEMSDNELIQALDAVLYNFSHTRTKEQFDILMGAIDARDQTKPYRITLNPDDLARAKLVFRHFPGVTTWIEQRQDPNGQRNLHPLQAAIPTAPQVIKGTDSVKNATAGVKTRDQFPLYRLKYSPHCVVRTTGAANLTPVKLKELLSYIDDTQHSPDFYENILGPMSYNVDFNAYYPYEDGTKTYVNPLLYALQKNDPKGLEWAQLLTRISRRTILQTSYYINQTLNPLSEELKDTPLSPEARTWLQSQGVKIQQPQMPTLPSFQWNTAKAKIAAVVAALSFSGIFYRWWTSGNTKQHTQNVLINNTGADIFINGSETPIAPNAAFVLTENSTQTITIKLNKDQDDAKDLKINMTDYAQDMENRYLNLSIGKKWFANWFTVPLAATPNWVKKSAANVTK